MKFLKCLTIMIILINILFIINFSRAIKKNDLDYIYKKCIEFDENTKTFADTAIYFKYNQNNKHYLYKKLNESFDGLHLYININNIYIKSLKAYNSNKDVVILTGMFNKLLGIVKHNSKYIPFNASGKFQIFEYYDNSKDYYLFLNESSFKRYYKINDEDVTKIKPNNFDVNLAYEVFYNSNLLKPYNSLFCKFKRSLIKKIEKHYEDNLKNYYDLC